MTSAHEESGDNARIVLLLKGKRTKRQRSVSPLVNVAAVSGSEQSSLETREEKIGEFEATVEDEDMANCLMLLSQGHKANGSSDQFWIQKMGFLSNKQPVATLLDGVYQCKTCDKSFHSFQALGGHRASHKKTKHGASVFKCDEKKSSFAIEKVESKAVGSFLSLQVTSSDGSKNLDKTHECWICKAEFSSGQALGGHMRRHRGLTNANHISTIKTVVSSSHHDESIRTKNFLELDLNLPATPEDESKFMFASKDQILLSFATTSTSLIDCHH